MILYVYLSRCYNRKTQIIGTLESLVKLQKINMNIK